MVLPIALWACVTQSLALKTRKKNILKNDKKPSAAESFELLAPASYLQGAESGLSEAQSLKRVQLVGLGEVR